MYTKRLQWQPALVGQRAALVLMAAFIFASPVQAAKPIGGGGGGGGGGKAKPSIAVSPTSVAFGDQAVGSTSTRAVSVTNSGNANLLISGITPTGSSAFSHSHNCPGTLAPAATCGISVSFTPGTAGAVSGNIAIASNASNGTTVNIALSGNGTGAVATVVRRVTGAGDSILMGYNASCTRNTGLFDFICYGGGDQPQYSFLDGSSSSVTSLVDRYVVLDPLVTGNKGASASGSEMTDALKNNFAAQAAAIVSAATQPTRVFVELGGNDLCNRATIAELYTVATWESAVRAGLDKLVQGLPDGSTVLLVSVPRVQDLRKAGIAKQTSTSGVNCENFWASFDVCPIGTASGTDLTTRLAALDARQREYNQKLVELATAYNGIASDTGVEVVAEYDANANASVGSYSFQASDLNGGDCFHPSIQGQNKLSEIIWGNRPSR